MTVIARIVPAGERSSSENVYHAILDGLYQGRYVPGQRLVEADLTRELGVGRNSVREALNRLAAEGVVSLNLHRGASIRLLNRREATDVLVLLEGMIGVAARLAAQTEGAAGEKAQLTALAERLTRLKGQGDFFEFIRLRNSFYQTLVRIGGNKELARILPSLHVHVVRTQFRGYEAGINEDRLVDYEIIAQAVVAGSSRRAESAARRHFRSVWAAIMRLPDTAFARES